MESGEKIFIIGALLFLAILWLLAKTINWEKLGFKPKPWLNGLFPILAFSVVIFFLVQLVLPMIKLPEWVLDKDPIINLLILGALQEILFRSLLVSWLERWGRPLALWGSSIIFAATHLALPDPWLMTGLSLAGGLFWAWHFMKYRNIYLLTLSHLVVNLSFNFLLFMS